MTDMYSQAFAHMSGSLLLCGFEEHQIFRVELDVSESEMNALCQAAVAARSHAPRTVKVPFHGVALVRNKERRVVRLTNAVWKIDTDRRVYLSALLHHSPIQSMPLPFEYIAASWFKGRAQSGNHY